MGIKPKTRITKCGRECTRCGKWKPWKSFNLATKGTRGRRSSCQECDRLTSASWRAKTDYYQSNRQHILDQKRSTYDPLHKKDKDLRLKYGIDIHQFQKMFDAQGGRCAICEKQLKFHCNKMSEQAVVDHDHTTGVIRGVLCHSCNRGLGLLGDTYKRLVRATEYVRTSTTTR